MRKLVSSLAGFTLVELMVTVGIVGVMAAVAVPRYQKFVAKTRQTEIKISLSNLYMAERVFHDDTGHYTICTVSLIQPSLGNSSRYYAYGFESYMGASPSLDCGVSGPANGCAYCLGGTPGCSASAAGGGPYSPSPYDNGGLGGCDGIPNSSFVPQTTKVNPVFTLIDNQATFDQQGSAEQWADSSGWVSASGFVARGMGNVSSSNIMDVWMINDQKQISNFQSGL